MIYTPLHVHSSRGSLLDSTNTPQSLISRGKELGLKAMAISDHQSCANHLEFYKECKANDIKPILGMEGYVTDDMKIKNMDSKYRHILFLSKDLIGYKNLLKITSLGFIEGFYYKARIDLKEVKKQGLGKGIIATSACLGGEISQMILKETDKQVMLNKIQEYKNTFEEFYLEIQPINIGENKEQKLVNKTIVELAKETNTPLVATSDCHFTLKEDFELHNVFIQISKSMDNEVYKDCWLKSTEEMLNGFNGIDKEVIIEALENTNKIAEKCNVELTIGDGQVPSSEIPKGYTKEDYFYKIIVDNCKKKKFNEFDKEKKDLYWSRIKHEFYVMKEKGFIDYFLLLYEILNEARKQNIIISPSARGSAASSLICYVLGITHVDPIEYNLIFERFLTIEKKGLPD